MPAISLIVAMDRNALIGTDTGLPWRLPADLKRFRAITWGKPIIMGRRTYEHIGRALPGRANIILSHQPEFQAPGCVLASSVDSALDSAVKSLEPGSNEVFVIGGSQIYGEFLPRCTRIHLTLVGGDFQGNTYFPAGIPGPPDWKIVLSESSPADAANPHEHQYLILERKHS
jgi:dihydrofolate reductase